MEKLRNDHTEVSSYLEQVVLSNEQVENIKDYCESIKYVLDNATFEQKRRVLEMLDVRGTLAIEEDERVIYVKCLETPQQRLSLAPTSPSSNLHWQNSIELTARFIVAENWHLE
ncbi:MAG: hypothetical protein HND47_24655 [Chloroflexi bacterium]|nr:hypothetical protein [Chloroflexota bacterium]